MKLVGWKTYLIAGIMFAAALYDGWRDLAAEGGALTVENLWHLLEAAGLAALRAGVTKSGPAK